MQPVQMVGSTVSQSSGNEDGLSQNPEGEESSGGVFAGGVGVVDDSGNKLDLHKESAGNNVIDFKAEIQRIKDADQAKENAERESEGLPSEGEADDYEEGLEPPAYDKQFVRNFLLNSEWDRNSIPPNLPDDVIDKTRKKYLEIFSILTGRTL